MNRRLAFPLLTATALTFTLVSGCATTPKPAAEALASDILAGRSNQLACGPDEVLYCVGSGWRINSMKKASECGCIPGPAILGMLRPR